VHNTIRSHVARLFIWCWVSGWFWVLPTTVGLAISWNPQFGSVRSNPAHFSVLA